MTTLELTVSRFVEHKRAIGRKYESEAAELRLLVRSLSSAAPAGLRSSRRSCWMTSRRRGPARVRVVSIICWASCAACSTGPSYMSC